MSRIKRGSPAIISAEKRLSGLVTIDPKLDLGNGNTVEAYAAKITSTQTLLDDYNTKLSELDTAKNNLDQAELELDAYSANMRTAVGLKYGRNSNEYEQAGGTRTSERKAPVRKAKTTTTK
jgi:hypothetical protein